MSLRGYSYFLLEAIKEADPKHIGVRLGRFCVDNNVPVALIANQFKVSRMTIYTWFTGKSMPRKDKIELIESYLNM